MLAFAARPVALASPSSGKGGDSGRRGGRSEVGRERGTAAETERFLDLSFWANASTVHNRNISRVQKLRLGGGALGADPAYLLYLPP
eukprot:COSAG04_NODE_22038_length_362_cov_1.171103_1_plen_86_part_10